MLTDHLDAFVPDVCKLGERLVAATIDLHSAVRTMWSVDSNYAHRAQVAAAFLPSAVKFQYQYNLRELTAIVQGLRRMTPSRVTEPAKAVRLWSHECVRVLSDRMASDADLQRYRDLHAAAVKRHFEDAGGVRVMLTRMLTND